MNTTTREQDAAAIAAAAQAVYAARAAASRAGGQARDALRAEERHAALLAAYQARWGGLGYIAGRNDTQTDGTLAGGARVQYPWQAYPTSVPSIVPPHGADDTEDEG